MESELDSRECVDIALGAKLAPLHEFWEHWGFVPWKQGDFTGIVRKQRFVKDGILGPVAQYWAWEAIVWGTGCLEERERLWHACKPIPETMTQRFLFLLEKPWPERKMRSFLWGFRGYVEYYAYWPGQAANVKAQDLTGLVDLALNYERKKNGIECCTL